MNTNKLTHYWVNTKKYCGCIAVNKQGFIVSKDTAPCYKWMSGKKFSKQINWMKYKKYLRSYKKLQEER